MENETYKVKAKKTMFEDRLWRGIHITGVGADLKKHGIRRQFACSYTPQQNGEEESTSWRNRTMNAKNVQPGRMHDD